MRFYLFILLLVLLSLNSNAGWQAYQNDLRNSGSSNGTGYFPLKTANFSNDDFGMDFQPLVDDLDDNGNREIIVFSNDSLIVFNPQLDILAQANVGTILGQPALFNFDNDRNIEIIFNSRQKNGSQDYFFAYKFNKSNLKQEFNISLSHDANFSGIKCFGFNTTNYCVFKDKENYVHILNLDSKTDSSYNTSAYNETRQTVPAIGDIDNDGTLEAVFWINVDGNGGYGFLAFDLNDRKADWIVDNIFASFSGSPSTFVLKGQPVLADLNNDGKLEIAASVFYDDNLPNFDPYNDWFTELFVYDYNGTKLFSKCELNGILNNGCNDGSSVVHLWEGTNPFVMDYNADGADDICFIKDRKSGGYFDYMALNCYNYSGDEIANAKLINVEDGITGNAMTADIDNDGRKDIITLNNIYSINGTALKNLPLGKPSIIAVDVDGNNGLDLIWTASGQTKVFLDSNNYSIDLAVLDINFFKFNRTHINVSAVIKNNGQVEANKVKTMLRNEETLENISFLIDLKKGRNMTIGAVLALKENEKVMASADYDNEINESDENNNDLAREFMGLPFVFVSSAVEPFNANSEFQDYIKNKLSSGYYTTNGNDADVKVYIGKFNPVNQVNKFRTLDEFGYDYGDITYYDKKGTKPYNGLISAFKDQNGKVIVMVVGNEIEGTIAGVKEFIRNQAVFLDAEEKEAVFVDDENADAVKVFDYLHNGVNNEHYMQQTEQFRNIVRRALNDSMFIVTEYNVTTPNNIVLRLRNIKTNLSSDYLLYLNSSQDVFMPVVMAGGIWSDITAWQELGGELSSNGRDVWLIEITGGPNIECDDCINYNYTNLVDEFWPALIGAVQGYTDKNKIQYVGHSNGCRTALDALTNWSSSGKNNVGVIIKNGNNITVSLSSNPVDTFVAVGCPGNFSELSYFAKQVKNSGDVTIKRLETKNNLHPKFGHVAHELESALGEIAGVSRFFDNPRISLNLFRQYYNWIRSEEDRQPGDKLTFSHFTLIYGTDGFLFSKKDDQIVAVTDELTIYDKINSSDKNLISVTHKHTGMTEDKNIKSNIKKTLNS